MLDHQSSLDAFSAAGAYRRVIAKATQVQFDIVKMQMQHSNDDLLTPRYLEEPDPTLVLDPEQSCTKALRIRFNLSTSSYATMFLREVTRMSSAFSQ